ncbi:MAG: signal peptide peptidase SppA [Bacteroidota bacterium]|nr:signal peptide peptidase SppA [Bacteroidota bacterium]
MRQFFKFTFASALGFLLTFIVLILILFGIISSAISFAEDKTVLVSDNSILSLKLNTPVTDRGVAQPSFGDFASFAEKPVGLNDILKNIKKASADEKIKGIYINITEPKAGIATLQEIRNALKEFKKSGKFIISYAENYSQASYYIASVSDKVYLNPEGAILFKGLNAEIMFYKNLLEKIDVEAQIIRHGKFKSAVEPFFLEKMSKANKEQTKKYISSIWNELVNAISESRKISVEELNNIADKLLLETANDAVKYQFADKLLYKDEIIALLRNKAGINKNEKLSVVTMKQYVDAIVPKLRKTVPRNKIAVIYAQGSIKSGEGEDLVIGSEKISRLIRKARKDSTIKAIVFRVNSPGGSALASDVMWRETVLAAKTKPFVVSMGDVAASGGYYISCAADSIFASPTTITGSIGVFGVIPNFQGLVTDKIGITFDHVKTNENSGFFSVNRPLTKFERNIIQKSVETIYDSFITKVSVGRDLTKEQVDNIGQGRVWAGSDAKEIGLIDAFGGLNRAILSASRMAKIENNYRIVEYPKTLEPLEKIINELKGNDKTIALKTELGPLYSYYSYLKEMYEMKGVQARLPYEINIY